MPDHPSRLRSATITSTSTSTSTATPVKLVFDHPASGTTLQRTVSGPNPPASVKIRFEPSSSGDTLSGKPSAWCNSPGAGKALVFDVPVTVGGVTSGELEVHGASGGSHLQIPIKIDHDI